jgi:cell division septation protein DedD
LFASIELGRASRGFILNASEGGLCVQAAREIVGDEPLELRFQSVQPGAWVEARGRIAWRNETRTVAGIEFVDLTPEIVLEIRKWLFFGASLQELRGNWEADQSAMEPAVADCNLSDDSGFQEHAAIPRSRLAEIGKQDVTSSRWLFEPDNISRSPEHPPPPLRTLRVLALAIFIVLSLALLARWHVGSARQIRSLLSKKEEAPSSPSVQPAKIEPAAKNNPTFPAPLQQPPRPSRASKANPSPTPSPAVAASGSVLQAAAMTDQKNANELAESLRQRNFPAFVSKRNTDRFYRVLIGPYATDQSLRQAKSGLQNDAIKTIEKRWSP